MCIIVRYLLRYVCIALFPVANGFLFFATPCLDARRNQSRPGLRSGSEKLSAIIRHLKPEGNAQTNAFVRPAAMRCDSRPPKLPPKWKTPSTNELLMHLSLQIIAPVWAHRDRTFAEKKKKKKNSLRASGSRTAGTPSAGRNTWPESDLENQPKSLGKKTNRGKIERDSCSSSPAGHSFLIISRLPFPEIPHFGRPGVSCVRLLRP